MRTLSRLGIVGLLAFGLFLVVGAAPGDTADAAPAKATLTIPAKVKGGEQIDIDVKCRKSDTKANLHVSGNHVSVGTDISLDGGVAHLSFKVHSLALPGDYKIDLTCKPSKAKASATATVTI